MQEYTGQEPDELSLFVGDVVTVEETSVGRYFGHISANG